MVRLNINSIFVQFESIAKLGEVFFCFFFVCILADVLARSEGKENNQIFYIFSYSCEDRIWLSNLAERVWATVPDRHVAEPGAQRPIDHAKRDWWIEKEVEKNRFAY